MSEMVERVATAMASLAVAGGYKTRWEVMNAEEREAARSLARCAIEAMREPTVAMLSYETPDSMVHPDCFTCGGHLEGWRLMIDAALDTPSQITPHGAGS